MLELIIVMETRASNKSDYMYIKSTIDYYYKPRSCGIKPIYANTKSQLMQQNAKINHAVEATERDAVVVIFADYDREETLNDRLIDYCTANGYELVWMNPNIEEVYWGKSVDRKDKKREAEKFQQRKCTIFPNLNNLSNEEPLNKKRTSNVLCILDKYLERIDT